MPKSTISYFWRDLGAHREFSTGVSLHSHTNQSHEALDFLESFGRQFPKMRPLIARMERRALEACGIHMDYKSSYWTPPMTPKLAFDLEKRQIERLGLAPLVSLTDHDNIHAPMLLRTMPYARQIPISLEWSAPYGGVQSFHLGIHNLPSAKAPQWMALLEDFTAHPSDNQLTEILAALNRERDVMVVFNHPLWDLYLIGKEKHQFLVNEFLQNNGMFVHALELNGLRNWDENCAVRRLAEQWNMVLIAGGDRHCVEPNANINLSNATTFSEFVNEIRRERRSHVLFLPQYAEPWKYRMLQSTIDAVRYYPDFPQGSQAWDQRVFHPDAKGVVRPLRELWPRGRAPRSAAAVIVLVQLMGRRIISGGLRYAWSDPQRLRLALVDEEG